MANRLGQFFTEDPSLQQTVNAFIKNKPSLILEPSCGRGDLVRYVQAHQPGVQFDMHELDTSLEILPGIDQDRIVYGDFLIAKVDQLYATIIGNPPYVRTRTGNLYIDFIDKCSQLLEPDGELIFIVPSDFFHMTSAAPVIDRMMERGSFTDVYHPHDEHLFAGASIDVVVFRYQRTATLPHTCAYNDAQRYLTNHRGMITFSEAPAASTTLLGDRFRVMVGMVSGCEAVFKNPDLGNTQVLVGHEQCANYIIIDQMPSKWPAIDVYLCEHKQALLARRIRRFSETNWFQWGALRNEQTVRDHLGEPCIYVHNLTRKRMVAFVGKVQYFGANLIMLLPTAAEKMNLPEIARFLNSESFVRSFSHAGRFKIGQRNLTNVVLPAHSASASSSSSSH